MIIKGRDGDVTFRAGCGGFVATCIINADGGAVGGVGTGELGQVGHRHWCGRLGNRWHRLIATSKFNSLVLLHARSRGTGCLSMGITDCDKVWLQQHGHSADGAVNR